MNERKLWLWEVHCTLLIDAADGDDAEQKVAQFLQGKTKPVCGYLVHGSEQNQAFASLKQLMLEAETVSAKG